MGPLSYMWPLIDSNGVMWHMTVKDLEQADIVIWTKET